ncbi:unknown [Lactobacillus phage Lb338-1]|uniref:Uncharacterized protein n=1 Tax=Lactobacillus phage Lb338-1 TaxID=2892342 RepID=C1KFD8_9CAUD|nr:hypothetical protein lb338_phage_28 [Lactobacillus phage Lb338-1]ACO36949.1 unknown [Lactobacillus phage Lb338-1]
MRKRDRTNKKKQKIESIGFNHNIDLTAPFKGRSRRITAFKTSLRRAIKNRLKQLDREIEHSEK